jgi:signal transduction histidine kinase
MATTPSSRRNDPSAGAIGAADRQVLVNRYLRSATLAAARLSALVELDQVLHAAVETLVVDFDSALARIWLYDPRSNTLRLKASQGASRGLKAAPPQAIDVARDPQRIAEVARRRRPFIRNGLSGDPDVEADWIARERIVGAAAFPLMLSGRLSGVLEHFTRVPLRDDVVEVLATFAALVTASINDVQLMAERKRAEDRSRFLADASRVLAESLEYEQTLANLARLVVPEIADWCVVELGGPGEERRRVAIEHSDPAMVEFAGELIRRYPPAPDAPTGVPNVLRTGRPEMYPEVTEQMLEQAARDPDHLAMIRRLQLRSVIVAPLNARGRTLGAMTLVMAESGRRYDERDLAIATDLAERAAAAVDNAMLYAEMERAVELRNEFLSIASHELRTPVTIVSAYGQSLERMVRRAASEAGAGPTLALDRERLEGSLHNLMSATGRLTKLIQELLDVARVQRGVLELHTEPVDLGELVHSTVDAFRLQQHVGLQPIRERIELSVPDQPVVGNWDAGRLQQVVSNMLDNALKYSPAGGIVHVDVSVEAAGDSARQAHIVIRDEGIGIPAEQTDAIFQRFVRGSNASSRNYPGFGMGLAVSRQIVEALGGRIWAESGGAGTGAKFHVLLPGIDESATGDPGSAG